MYGSCPYECCVNNGYDCMRELLNVCAILLNGILGHRDLIRSLEGRAFSRCTKAGVVLLVARYWDVHILLGIGYLG